MACEGARAALCLRSEHAVEETLIGKFLFNMSDFSIIVYVCGTENYVILPSEVPVF